MDLPDSTRSFHPAWIGMLHALIAPPPRGRAPVGRNTPSYPTGATGAEKWSIRSGRPAGGLRRNLGEQRQQRLALDRLDEMIVEAGGARAAAVLVAAVTSQGGQ